MAYITREDVEGRFGTLTDEQFGYFTSVLLPSVQMYIENVTGTLFGNSTTSDVYVDGEGGKMLVIPTMSDVTSVSSIDESGTETPLDSSAWTKYPRTRPVLAIRSRQSEWTEGFENYKVTGKIGYSSVPFNIKAIAMEMAINELRTNVGNYKSERVGDWSVTYGDTSTAPLSDNSLYTLQNYRRISRSV